WTGNGLTSSKLAIDYAATGPHSTTLALIDNADLNLPSLNGIPLDANSLIVTRALLGDSNLDNIIDASDFDPWWLNVGNHKSTTSSADFNLSGTTDASDFDLWFQHVGLTALPLAPNPSPPGLTPSPIPEPTSLLLFPLILLLRRPAPFPPPKRRFPHL